MEGAVIVVLLFAMAAAVVVRLRLERYEDRLGLWLIRRGLLGASLIVLGAAAGVGVWVTHPDAPPAAWVTIAVIVLAGVGLAFRERRHRSGVSLSRPNALVRESPTPRLRPNFGPYSALVEALLKTLGARTASEWRDQARVILRERSLATTVASSRGEARLHTATRSEERAAAAAAARRIIERVLPEPLLEEDETESELARALLVDAASDAAQALVVVDLLTEAQRRQFLGAFSSTLPPLPR